MRFPTHKTPTHISDRARDTEDLLLVGDLITATRTLTLTEVRQAGLAFFEAHAAEAGALDRPIRNWPPIISAHDHWGSDHLRAAESGGIRLSLKSGLTETKDWIVVINNS